MTLRRIKPMKRILTPLAFVLLLAACGSTSEVGTGSSDTPGDGQSTEDVIDGREPAEIPGGEEAELPAEPLPLADGDTVITNDVIVDPRVTTPSEVVVNPDNASELWVRFIGADPNCTAASVTVLTETPDVVEVELLVGITEDALARSCVAGEFNLRVDVPLSESAEGKQLGFVRPTSEEPVLITPDLTSDDFLGLTEDEALALVEENQLVSRTVRVDGEFFIVTEDFLPERLNFEFDDGVVTSVGFG